MRLRGMIWTAGMVVLAGAVVDAAVTTESLLDDMTNLADDVLYANDSFVCLHAGHPGRRLLRLPESRRVVDVFADDEIASPQTREIRIACDRPFTQLWYIGRQPWERMG